MKLIRWKYVLPRLLIVLVVALAIRFGLDPALKWALVSGGEATVGAKVEVRELKTSLRTGKLVVTDVVIANPRAPMRNLLQTSESRLLLDVNALLRGRVIVRDGTLSGIEFDTDRTTSGALEETVADEEEGPSALQPWIDSGKELSTQWLDDLANRLDADLVGQLQTPRLAKELEDRWPEQYESIRQQVDTLQRETKLIEQDIRAMRENPLRNFQRLAGLQQRLTATQQKIFSLQQQIAQLPRQAESDRQAVLAAREQDQQFLRQQLKFGAIDEQGLTQTLLGREAANSLANALEWVSWARSQLPARGDRQKATRSRGTTVVFTPPQPRYLVEQLKLSGKAQLGGQPLHLVGTLTGACSEPQLLSEPMRLALHGSGASDLGIEITVDRREAIAKDHFCLHCPQLTMPSRRLGGEKLAVEVAPGAASVQVDLELTGDKLAGKIDFAQGSVQLTPNAGTDQNEHLTELLRRALASVNLIEAEVVLGGTIEKPEMKIESDLGAQLAAGVNQAAEQLLLQRSEQLLAETREKVDQRLTRLAELREKAEQEFLATLGEGQQVLKQLAALQSGGGRLPGLPISGSFPHLGKSLRPDTQLK